MRFLTQKCHFDTQKATWTCYWADTFERAIVAFRHVLATKKSESVVTVALQSVRVFVLCGAEIHGNTFLFQGNGIDADASRPKDLGQVGEM